VSNKQLRVVGLAEVADLLRVSKRTASRWTARDDFPKPVTQLAMGPIWLTADVERWVAGNPVRRGRPPGRASPE
jgi:predicted DNA-binding transcriptional regulator AlpA